MEQRQQKSSMVLKYNKRRFDGGTEIEMIRTIERRNAIAQLERLSAQTATSNPITEQPIISEQPVLQPPAPHEEPAPVPRKSRVLEATILGPMELSVGIVGIMTATLAIYTFHRLNNQPLLKQSQGVLRDCVKTFNKGIVDTLTTPVRVVKAAAAKA